jgi:hypothetical protein
MAQTRLRLCLRKPGAEGGRQEGTHFEKGGSVKWLNRDPNERTSYVVLAAVSFCPVAFQQPPYIDITALNIIRAKPHPNQSKGKENVKRLRRFLIDNQQS